MIIKKILIESFGKFSGHSMTFSKGFNLIYGKNEAGKSTIMSFIKLMFYGNSGKSGDILKNIRKKYTPWDGSSMSGSIELETGNDSFRIHKNFGKTTARDIVSISNLSSGEKLTSSSGEDIGTIFFNMDSDEFERSIFVGNSGSFSSETSGSALAMRIANLATSGDENISRTEILHRLQSAKEELVSKSEKKGLLVDAQRSLENLRYEADLVRKQTEDQASLMLQISNLKKDISVLEEALETANQASSAKKARQELKTLSNLWEKMAARQSLVDYMAKWNPDISFIRDVYQKAKKLRIKISQAEYSASPLITSEDYQEILDLEKEIFLIDQDKLLLNDEIKASKERFETNYKKTLKKYMFSASISSVFLGALLCYSILLLCTGNPVGIYLLASVALLTYPLVKLWLKTRKKTGDFSALALDVVFLKHLSVFSNSIENMSAQDIMQLLDKKLYEISLVMEKHLKRFQCKNVDELKAKAPQDFAKAELQNSSERAKNDYILYISELENVSSFENANEVFEKISSALAELDGYERDISAISSAIGIAQGSTETIKRRMEQLLELSNAYVDTEVCDTKLTKNELAEKRNLLGEIQSKIVPPAQDENFLSSQIAEAEQTAAGLSERYRSLELALEAFSLAVSETNKGLGSVLSKKTGEHLEKMSSGKYSDLFVSQDLNVEVLASSSDGYKEWKYLSSGAIDRVYFALRLAATDIIYDGKNPLPLFLDDIFAQYDRESCVEALKYLKDYLQKSGSVSQIFFFTCHQHIADMAKEIMPDLNEITL